MMLFQEEAEVTPEFLSQRDVQEFVKEAMARRLVKKILDHSRMSLESTAEPMFGNIKLTLKIEIQDIH